MGLLLVVLSKKRESCTCIHDRKEDLDVSLVLIPKVYYSKMNFIKYPSREFIAWYLIFTQFIACSTQTAECLAHTLEVRLHGLAGNRT